MSSTVERLLASHGRGFGRRQFLALAAVTPLAIAEVVHAAGADDPVETLVADFVRRGNVDGLSVAVIRDGRTHFYNAGVISRETRAPASELSVYEIGSISKTFTGLLLAHAITEGRTAASDDVRHYLPPGYDNLVRDGRPVQLIDLVNTTSALPDNLPDWRTAVVDAKPADIPFIAAELINGSTPQSLMAELRTASLVDTPGAIPRHSNVASQVAGIVLERLYDRPYEALLARYIEQPFGMASGAAASPPHLVQGYDPGGPAMPALTAPVVRPAGALRYSTSDMARYIAAQLAVRDPAIALTHQPAWGTVDADAIGFHWMIRKTADSQIYMRHSGGTFGFSAYCEFYPGEGYGIVLLGNRAGAQDTLGSLANAAHDALFGKPRGLVALEAALEQTRYADVGASVADTRSHFPELFLSESAVNSWGYRLMRAERPTEGTAMFAYNVAEHPESWNVHDSYAEALAAAGQKVQAIAHYRRSLALNPSNDNASTMIAQLSAQN